MKKLILIAAAICASNLAMGQTPPVDAAPEPIKCLKGSEMAPLFQSGEAHKLPNYSESSGARVQRQYPDTALRGQAKHILQADGSSLGICEYSNHVGAVAVFLLGGAQADAYDEACDDGTCNDDDYWRSDWREHDAANDQPGQEMIKACYRDINGRAFQSAGCGFAPPAE
ncbi:MAG: hypothetical protein ABJG15_00900 [Hyphomonadaceae bacterium]